MSLRECAALDVLARYAHVIALKDERAERKRFGGGPVDIRALLNGLAARREDTGEVAVRGETVGYEEMALPMR